MNEVKNHKSQAKAYTQQEIDDIINDCEQYRKTLIRLCRRFFDYEYEYAEDCVQNAYVALIENLQNGKEINNYYAWLYKVTMNYKNRALREVIARRENEFHEDETKGITIDKCCSYEVNYTDNMISDDEINQIAVTILAALTESEKNLYFYYYIRKEDYNIIAEKLGGSYPAVKQKHYMLKKKLFKLIRDLEKE